MSEERGFYYPWGEIIKGMGDENKQEFVRFYSQCYYLTNSRIAEERMQSIMETGIKSPAEVMEILEWKLGRIDHKKSQVKNEVCYRHEMDMKAFKTKTRSGEIDARELCEHVAKQFDTLKDLEPADIFQDIVKKNVKNLGTVYLITLVHFISKKCPIYDRFAHQAVLAINGNKAPGALVKPGSLPNKTSGNAFQKYEEGYINLLTKVFGDKYMDRDVDRALWVYGHLFREKE